MWKLIKSFFEFGIMAFQKSIEASNSVIITQKYKQEKEAIFIEIKLRKLRYKLRTVENEMEIELLEKLRNINSYRNM